MRPCDQCGVPVENDLRYCDRCSNSPIDRSVRAIQSDEPTTDGQSPEEKTDTRFLVVGAAATVATCVFVCYQLFLYLQLPLPFAVFTGFVVAFILLRFVSLV